MIARALRGGQRRSDPGTRRPHGRQEKRARAPNSAAVSEQEPQYTEITVLVHPDVVEGLVDVLLSLGAKGVVEERRLLAFHVTAYVPADDKNEERVRAIRSRLHALEAAGLRVGPGTIGVRTVGVEAWSEAWQDLFQVQRITPSLVLAPSWEEYQAQPGETVVVLDPGAAFGTGGHATTRLCLRALVEQIRPGDRVADVGCGSGILAITAALLGAEEVVATDSDSSALLVARQNARKNGVADLVRLIESDLVAASLGPFDLIVCNIIASEVTRLAENLRRLLAPGGRFIGSGFFITMVPMVEDALVRAGLSMLDTPSEEGWSACVAVKPGRKH
jgi:ribosomal protein L11 methyltransferase